MKTWVLALVCVFSACTAASAEDYCAQLQGAGLEGRLITVNTTHGSGQHVLEGRLLTVKPGILVLQLSGSRAFVNCANVYSLVVAEPVGQQGVLSDTIEKMWKAFGD